MENPWSDEIFTKAHPAADLSEMAEKTYAARDIVRSEVWELIDRVPQESSTLNPFITVGYMKIKPGKEQNYVKFEQDVWKSFHQERFNAGIINGWQLYSLRFPGGSGYEYNYATVNLYKNFTDLGKPWPEELFTKAHPGVNLSDAAEKTYAARDMVRVELWKLIDHTR